MHSQHLTTTAAAFMALAPCTSLNCNCSHVPDHLQASTNFRRSRTWWEQFAPCMFSMFVISDELMQNIPLPVSFHQQQARPCAWAKGERNALLASAFSFFVSPSACRYKCYIQVKTDSPSILSLIFNIEVVFFLQQTATDANSNQKGEEELVEGGEELDTCRPC